MSWKYEHEWSFSAPPKQVFAALTKSTQLRAWFAEKATVKAERGGAYRFWGANTLGTPTAEEATGKITGLKSNERLAYSWRLFGVGTVVDMSLEPSEKGTTLTLTHTLKRPLGVPRQRELIDDHWRLQMGNLAAHLAGGKGVVRADFADPKPEIRQTITINAPVTAVFRAMTEPALVNMWFGSTKARVTPVTGGQYWVGWQYKVDGRDVIGGTTRVLEIIPQAKLVLDWLDWRGDTSVTGQFIEFNLRAAEKKTTVRFVHGGFTRTADFSDYPFGWVYFLDQLKKVAESLE